MAIEHLEGKNFDGFDATNEMQPYVLKDTTGADIHVVFMNYCVGGWAAGGLCGKGLNKMPIAFSCHFGYINIYEMAETTVHEIGHLLGIMQSSFFHFFIILLFIYFDF